jgi:signal peptidase I
MTIQPELEPPRTNGSKSGNDVAVLDVATESTRARTTTPGPRRKYDYRLRGLDLDAVGLAEAPAPTNRKRHPSIGRRRRRVFVQTVVVLAAVALVAVAARATLVRPYTVSSTSMVPTIQPNTDVMVATTRLFAGSVERGDIIVFHQPDGARCVGGTEDLVSRVIAMPGDTIWSEQARVYVNGELLDERWHNPPFGEVGADPIVRTTVPDGSYFVMGDNRTDSCDSRSFGAVPSSDVVGEVVLTTMRDGHPFVHLI